MEITEEPKQKNNYAIIVAIIIGAWIIGMSILGAGWLITNQIAKNSSPIPETPVTPQFVDIDVPAGVPVLGDNNAPVTVIEFADFQCPYCGEWQKEIFGRLKTEYIDKGLVRFVYMDFAFLGAESYRSAQAARCAFDQGKYWEYHSKLFESQKGENEGAFSDVNLKSFADELNLDTNSFNECLDSKKYEKAVADDLSKATSYGVNSTPTVFINGYRYEGVMPYESYTLKIEEELDKEKNKDD